MHGLVAVVVVLTLVACYEPRYGECVVRCTATAECAPSQSCGSDGWCASAGVVGQCFQPGGDGARPLDGGSPIDTRVPPVDTGMPKLDSGTPPPDASMPPIDAGMPDAPDPDCGSDCPGTCQDGVCVIACTAKGSCKDDVVCPASTPCRVVCTGKDSCWGAIFCGSGRCTVSCTGNRSCKRGTWCMSSCACDVTCTGKDSCDEEAMCPANACRAGHGCTSQPSGCASC